ncbi:hypothetical protein ACTBGR_003543, partial [Shigella sonnei]
PAYGPQNDVTLKMPAFEWVHVQLHQQKGMISLSPPTICNSASWTHGNYPAACASKRRNYQAFTTTPNARFWHKADAHSHANALPLTCQQPYRLLRNYGFLLESSPLNKL